MSVKSADRKRHYNRALKALRRGDTAAMQAYHEKWPPRVYAKKGPAKVQLVQRQPHIKAAERLEADRIAAVVRRAAGEACPEFITAGGFRVRCVIARKGHRGGCVFRRTA